MSVCVFPRVLVCAYRRIKRTATQWFDGGLVGWSPGAVAQVCLSLPFIAFHRASTALSLPFIPALLLKVAALMNELQVTTHCILHLHTLRIVSGTSRSLRQLLAVDTHCAAGSRGVPRADGHQQRALDRCAGYKR